MRGKAKAAIRSGAFLVVIGALLSGCSDPENAGPGWTARPDPAASGTAVPGPDVPNPSGSGDDAATATASGSATAQAAATAAAWKTFSDPAETVRFELPREWIAQSVPPEEGSLPGALKIEVKKPDGTFVAALRTGLPPSSAPCTDGSKRPYTVISSLPVDLAAEGGDGTIPPRMVFRVIQGYRFFGSYGITNAVGGADAQACELRNTVRGPAARGDYSFGDVVALRAYAADEKVAPAKAFDRLDQAVTYVEESAEFANVQRMLMSLEIKN